MIPKPTLDTYCVSGLVLGTGWESRGWELKLDGGLLREVELGLRCRDFAVEMIGERVQVSGLGTRGTEVLSTEQEFRKTSQFGMPSNAGGNFHTGRSSPAEKEECRPGSQCVWDWIQAPVWPASFLSSLCHISSSIKKGFPGKGSSCNARDPGWIPGSGRSPGKGNGYPLQCSVLENSMDCTVHEVATNGARLSDFNKAK